MKLAVDPVTLARHLGALAQAARVHDIGNQAVARALGRVLSELRRVAASNGEARLEFDGDTVVLEGALVRLRRESRAQLLPFVAALREHGAGGFSAGAGLGEAHLAALFRGLATLPAGPREELQRFVDHQAGAGLLLLAPRVVVTGMLGGAGQSVRSSVSDALRAYLRALAAMRRALDEGTVARAPAPLLRALQSLTELAEEDPRLHLGLVAIRSDTDYDIRHPVNSALLALALGRRLGLDRRALLDLAFASLLAATLPADASGEARLRLAASLVQRPELSPGRVRRMLVVLESGLSLDREGEPDLPLRGPLHLYSRVAAVVAAYDERTTALAGRPAELPDEALASMLEDPRYEIGRAHV